MKMKSPAYGELEYSDGDVIHFPEGLIGFPTRHQFLLLQNPEMAPFCPLQCVDDPYLIFVTLDPRPVFKNYAVSFTAEDATALGAEKVEDLAVFSICIVPDDYSLATTNLRAPVLINSRKMLGRQVILPESAAYSHQQRLVPA